MVNQQTEGDAILHAAQLLERGQLVAFPTETVYGLGADAENPQAVARIYQAKGRPLHHPVIVHLAPKADIAYWARTVPEDAARLISTFWPGPLTLILKRASHIPDVVSGGQDSIGVRCPSHPVAQALLSIFKNGKGGVAAPSANRFGHVSPTAAQHVRDEFGEVHSLVSCVLDGGQSEVGIESTIVDLSRGTAVLLRPGHVSVTQLTDVLGYAPAWPDVDAPRASGTLDAHYAPATPVALVASQEMDAVLATLQERGCPVALLHYGKRNASPHSLCLPLEVNAYARGLYAALRMLDKTGSDIILVEMPPQDEAWRGINDRLRRAAHSATGKLERWLRVQT